MRNVEEPQIGANSKKNYIWQTYFTCNNKDIRLNSSIYMNVDIKQHSERK